MGHVMERIRARGWSALAVVALFGLVSCSPASPQVENTSERTRDSLPTAPTVEVVAPVVQFLTDEVGVSEEPEGPAWWMLGNPGPFDGPLTLQTTGAVEGDWIEVVVPILPNGTTGWVPREVTVGLEPRTQIVVRLADRKAQLFVDGEQVLEATVAVGAPETPTPRFTAIVDHIEKLDYTGGVYGSWVFGLNQHSEVLDNFDGARPAIALHGTNEPWLIGDSVSNGCVRFDNDDIALFAEYVELGTLVVIRR